MGRLDALRMREEVLQAMYEDCWCHHSPEEAARRLEDLAYVH
jgi:hypothetical protein